MKNPQPILSDCTSERGGIQHTGCERRTCPSAVNVGTVPTPIRGSGGPEQTNSGGGRRCKRVDGRHPRRNPVRVSNFVVDDPRLRGWAHAEGREPQTPKVSAVAASAQDGSLMLQTRETIILEAGKGGTISPFLVERWGRQHSSESFALPCHKTIETRTRQVLDLAVPAWCAANDSEASCANILMDGDWVHSEKAHLVRVLQLMFPVPGKALDLGKSVEERARKVGLIWSRHETESLQTTLSNLFELGQALGPDADTAKHRLVIRALIQNCPKGDAKETEVYTLLHSRRDGYNRLVELTNDWRRAVYQAQAQYRTIQQADCTLVTHDYSYRLTGPGKFAFGTPPPKRTWEDDGREPRQRNDDWSRGAGSGAAGGSGRNAKQPRRDERSGAGNQGSIKPGEPETDRSSKGDRICRACGATHGTAGCYYFRKIWSHPNMNNNMGVSWRDSEMGKRWAKAGEPKLVDSAQIDDMGTRTARNPNARIEPRATAATHGSGMLLTHVNSISNISQGADFIPMILLSVNSKVSRRTEEVGKTGVVSQADAGAEGVAEAMAVDGASNRVLKTLLDTGALGGNYIRQGALPNSLDCPECAGDL